MKLLNLHKKLSIAGVVLCLLFLTTQILLSFDDSGLNLDLFWFVSIIWWFIHIILFFFYVLSYRWNNNIAASKSGSSFKWIIVLGILSIFTPASMVVQTISNALFPEPQSIFNRIFDGLFEISLYRKIILRIETCLHFANFFTVGTIIYLTLRIRSTLKKKVSF